MLESANRFYAPEPLAQAVEVLLNNGKQVRTFFRHPCEINNFTFNATMALANGTKLSILRHISVWNVNFDQTCRISYEQCAVFAECQASDILNICKRTRN